MGWLNRMVRRAIRLVRRGEVERAMDGELRHHLDCEIADRIRGGVPPAEARRTALRDFGGLEAIKELARDARGGRTLEDVALDVRYAFRVLRRNPAYTAGAVLTFALGVGAVTAIFSLVYGILLRPLPYADPDRLVAVWESNVPRKRDRNVVSLDSFETWRDRARSFQRIAAVVPTSITLPGDPAPERLVGADVTPGYFGTLGVRPALGRDFSEADARHGLSVILGDGLWRRRFGADPSIVGRPLAMSGKTYTVVGVMPRDFDPPRLGWLGQQDLWFPFVATPQSRAWGRFLIVLARLGPGVPAARAGAEVAALAAERAATSPESEGWSASVIPLQGEMTGDVRVSLLVLLGAVGLLLTMAVANVGTLTLSLLARRTGEIAVRRAIGATDRRLFGQLFTQSALVGAVGAAIGALVAVPGVRLLVALLPPDIPRPDSVAVDSPVLLVTTAASLTGTILFGTIGAMRGCRSRSIGAPLAGAGRGSTRAGSGALVVMEIALAVALGVMAVLMARSFGALRAVELGFRPEGIAVARVALPGTYATAASQRAFFDELIARVQRLPGVTAAGIISARPFGGIGPATTIRDATQPAASNGDDPVADIRYADRGALAALGVPIRRGTPFDGRDADGPSRVLVSETLARTIWPDRDPIGRTLALTLFGGMHATVAGVVGDVHLQDARTTPKPVAYLAASRFTDRMRDIVVRVEGADPASFIPALRSVLAAMDPSLPLYAATTMPTLVDAALARDRLIMFLLVGFAIIALLLAGVGVFGVFAGEVASRRKEIGIRVALGAGPSRVLLLLLRRTATRVAIGVAGGAAVALLGGRVMESLLFGVRSADPVSFASTAALVGGIAAMATLVPGWRALRQSPLSSLRES